MAKSRYLKYNDGSVNAYTPTFERIDPDTFAKTARDVLSSRASRGFASGPSSPVGTKGLFSPGMSSFLAQMDQNTKDLHAKQIMNNPDKKLSGKQRSELSPEVRKLYDQVRKDEHKAGIKHKAGNFLGRVLDILSRPNYAVAEMTKRAFDEGVSGDEGFLNDLGDAFAEGAKGAWSGLTGKSKNHFSNVMQHSVDVKKALKEGKTPQEAVKTELGYAHSSKKLNILKEVTGFTLDVALDPTTYLGVGVVKDVMKGAGIAAKTGEAAKDVEHMSNRLFKEYGIHADMGEDGKDLLRHQITGDAPGGQFPRTGGAGEARAARVTDARQFAGTVKATVAAREYAKATEELTAARASEFITPPVTAEVKESAPKFMDVPVYQEDHLRVTKYTSRQAEINSRLATVEKELNNLKTNLSKSHADNKVRTAEIKQVHEAQRVKGEKVGKQSKHTVETRNSGAATRNQLQRRIADLEAQKADLVKKRDANEKWFNDHFNVSEADAQLISRAHQHIKAHPTPELKALDEEITKTQRTIEGIKKRYDAKDRKAAKATDNANKPHADNALPAAEKRLKDLHERRHHLRAALAEKHIEKIAPDRGSLISKARSMADYGKNPANSLVHAFAAALEAGDTESANILRRELAYRFNEKGDKWWKRVGKAAPEGPAKDELRNLTPLMRPGKHTLKRRQLVVEKQPVRAAPTKKELAEIEAHNARIAKEIADEADQRAKHISNEISNSLLEMMLRESAPNFKRGIGLKINIPFTADPNMTKTMFALKLPDAVSEAVGKYIFRDTFKQGLERWAGFFKSSAGLDPLLNRMRLAYNGAANMRIEVHANRLRNIFLKVKPPERVAALRQYLKHGADGTEAGPYGELVKRIDEEVNLLSGVFKLGTVGPVEAHDAITRHTINRYLPEKLHLASLRSIDSNLPVGSPEWIRASLSHIGEATDPAELLWHLNIAREKVLTKVALKDNIRATFGIEHTAENADQIKILVKNNYKTVPELGNRHYFPAEVADDVAKTLDLIKNEHNVNELIKFYDRVLGIYKSTVTMWNPSYHFRNSFGDAWMNYLRGVSGPQGMKSYSYSRKTLLAMRGKMSDDPVQHAIMQLDPIKAFEQTAGVNPKTPLFKWHNGKNVTAEEIWVLYNHYGLHSGFVSNEFGVNFAAAGSMRATKTGQAASTANRKVRELSESREDFFRLTHFIHVMRYSKSKDMKTAAAEAADSVRKYMFDYSDFTQIEKSVMIRAIPFYKWTRKALPLMIETMFAQPGKALMYPKAMRAVSGALGYPTGDSNGVIPQSDLIIPDWVRQRGMFPIGTNKGNTVLGDVAVPFNDVTRFVGAPVDNVVGMLTPALRAPAELATGRTMYGQMPINDKTDYALRNFPQSSFLMQMLKKQDAGEVSGTGTLTDPRTLQFLSGIGLFENTDTQQKNALLGRQADARKAITKRNKEKKGKN